MRFQVTGYNIIKDGEWTLLHALDLRQRANLIGFAPFVSRRGNQEKEGLWIPKSLGFVATKELVNKVVNVEFGPSGSIISIQVEK